MGIYTYIYSHAQKGCFVVSQLFNVARHIEPLKQNPPNFMLDFVSLSISINISYI